MKKTSSIFLLLSLAICWSFFAIFTKIGAAEAPFYLIGFSRCFFGFLPLYFLCFFKKKNFLLKKNFKHYAIIGIFNSAIPFCLYGFAAQGLDSGVMTILDGSILVFEVAITTIILKQYVSRKAIIGAALGIVGIILVSLGNKNNFNFDLTYLLAVLFATLCYATCSIYISRKCHEIDPIILACGSTFFASLILSPALLFGDLQNVSNPTTLASLASLGIFCTGCAYIFYFTLIKEEGSRVAVSTSFIVPVLGMILGIIFMKEEIYLIRIAGCALILLGMKLILNLSTKKSTSQNQCSITQQ